MLVFERRRANRERLARELAPTPAVCLSELPPQPARNRTPKVAVTPLILAVPHLSKHCVHPDSSVSS